MKKCPVTFCAKTLRSKEDLDRHLRLVHGWAKLVLLIALILSGVGCHKHKDDPINVENLQGVWTGTVNINGVDKNVYFNLVQNGTSISYGDQISYFKIDYGIILAADVTGTVSGRAFTLTGDEGAGCANKWSFSGEVSNGLMLVGITGNGNIVPGSSCYSQPLNQTFTLHR